MGALVLLLGTAFAALLVEPTQVSARAAAPSLQRAAAVLALPEARPPGRPGDDRFAGVSVSDMATLTSDQRVASPAAPAEASPPTPALDGMRVRIARLAIDLPLLPGDTSRDTVLGATPNGAAFLLPSSALPGAGGNSYVYAHARAGMFLSLWNARLGDIVEVTAPSGQTWRYVVIEIHPRVAPTDVRHALPTGDERITLQTSTGPRGTDPRFVVVAVRGN